MIGERLPAEGFGSGYGRTVDALRALANTPGQQIDFHPRVTPAGIPDEFSRLGIRVITDLGRHLDAQPGCYDTVIVSRPHDGDYYRQMIDEYLPNAAVIYEPAQELTATEWELLRWTDAVVCTSEPEARVIRAQTPAAVHVVQQWLATPRPTTASFNAREDIAFVAGWLDGPGSPNCEGLLWFAHEVLPRIRAVLPHCRLLVTGGNPPHDVTWLAGSAVEFVGMVDDLWSFYDLLRVVIEPTRMGAGVNLKTAEAIQYGVPLVSTMRAVSGFEPAVSDTVWASDSPEVFATAVIELMSDETAWRRTRAAQLGAFEATPQDQIGGRGWPRILDGTTRIAQRERARG
jgi:glycosyltransferase involved in cell wall biosynthesis